MRISDWSSDVCSSDLADIEAGAAQRLAAFRARHLEAQLRGADRGDVAARPGTDHEDVIVVLLVSHFPLRPAPAEAGAQGNQRRGLRPWALLSQGRGALNHNVRQKSLAPTGVG